MAEIREIHSGSTNLAVPALQSLRPHLDTTVVIQIIDDLLRPAGYRLIGVFDDGEDSSAQAIAGFRVTYALVRGRHLVIDEMATVPAARGRGYAGELVDWLKREGLRTDCFEIHLDSAVGPDRAAAHRLYHRQHLRISAHHFHCEL